MLRLLTIPLATGQLRAASPDAAWKVDDVLATERFEGFELSPDATRLVWVKESSASLECRGFREVTERPEE